MSNASLGAALAARSAGTGEDDAPAKLERITRALRAAEPDFAAAMPAGRDAGLLVHDVTIALRQEPALLGCDVDTVIGAAMTCAQLGLRVGVLGHAWITPVRGDDSVAQLIIGYQGFHTLAMRSGLVLDLNARTVYERDYYEVDYGCPGHRIVHRPPLRGQRGERGEPTDYYAAVRYTSGGHDFWTMSRAEVEAHRDKWAPRGPAREDGTEGPVIGPWATHFDPMAAKTCFRRLSTWMPKSTELEWALAADHRVRVDRDPRAITDGYLPGPYEAAVPVPDHHSRPDRS